ncbi:L-ascorbate oxidase-like [Phoenix dactylifera]|uniref:L-ascorbate oxidase n=1 Tax=Phoenix dactylifera TaxID=42345 RepID=A0A8B8ZTR3_PHODC|nr:L-ascorbate oxidase-like [Phoenix dactylifera]XP_038977670.1 L-ascorbate oxidase-like [Phoenix dactylifera]
MDLWPDGVGLAAKLPLLFFLIISATTGSVRAKIHYQKWEVAYQFKSPDCFQKLAITINGRTPGPTIIAEQGDTVVIDVKNALLTENLAIHWHGIRQIGTPWFDGTEGVTQCPVVPRDTFTYRFVVDRSGTYMYHAHYEMQRSAGLYGLIRVLPPAGVVEPFIYDYDRSIILNDWWHQNTYEQAVGLSSKNFTWVGEPQSLLINGRGKFNCSNAGGGVCNATNPECSPYVLTVIPGKTYRLRIASITSLSALNFEVEGHNLTVIAADGHYVKPFMVKNLNIYSGETYSVLLKAEQDPSRNYWAVVNVVSRNSTTPTGTAILNYYPNHPRRLPPTVLPTGPLWNDTMYRFNQSIATRSHPDYIRPPPTTSDRMIILLNTQNCIDGYVKWAVNNVSLNLPQIPYLITLKERMLHAFDQKPAPETYDYKNYDIYDVQKNRNATASTSIHRLVFNSTIDVILQNANTMKRNNSETHPWHLHGHAFWVLGYGMGKFDPETDPKRYNLVDPIMKNTVAVHPYGWTALRFRADNPGVWAFHCHIEPHFFMGMGVVFEEGVDKLGKLPVAIMGCGESKHIKP